MAFAKYLSGPRKTLKCGHLPGLEDLRTARREKRRGGQQALGSLARAPRAGDCAHGRRAADSSRARAGPHQGCGLFPSSPSRPLWWRSRAYPPRGRFAPSSRRARSSRRCSLRPPARCAGYRQPIERGAVIRERLHGRVIELDEALDDVEEGEVEVQIRSIESATPRPPDLLEVIPSLPPGTERLTRSAAGPERSGWSGRG